MKKIICQKIAKTRVDEDIYEALKKISIKKKISVQQILRKAIKDYVLDNLEFIILKDQDYSYLLELGELILFLCIKKE